MMRQSPNSTAGHQTTSGLTFLHTQSLNPSAVIEPPSFLLRGGSDTFFSDKCTRNWARTLFPICWRKFHFCAGLCVNLGRGFRSGERSPRGGTQELSAGGEVAVCWEFGSLLRVQGLSRIVPIRLQTDQEYRNRTREKELPGYYSRSYPSAVMGECWYR